MSSESKPILFYDIASAPPATTYSPNPWKTRYALNFKGVEYETKWVELPDVKSTRMGLECVPVRKLPSGEDFYTLPVIHDTATGKIVGDTFDIACYLDETYPEEKKTLIPTGYADAIKEFNANVDKVFTIPTVLCAQGIPFNPATAEQSKAEFVRRAGLASWDQIVITDPAIRAQLLQTLKTGLDELFESYASTRKRQNFATDRTDGPILDGKYVPYADIIIASWLQFYKKACLEFDQIATWHDGIWVDFLKAMEPYALVK